MMRDEEKNRICEEKGINLITIPYSVSGHEQIKKLIISKLITFTSYINHHMS